MYTALDNHVNLQEDPCTLTEAKICALGTECRVSQKLITQKNKYFPVSVGEEMVTVNKIIGI